jgi:hypothetical protein
MGCHGRLRDPGGLQASLPEPDAGELHELGDRRDEGIQRRVVQWVLQVPGGLVRLRAHQVRNRSTGVASLCYAGRMKPTAISCALLLAASMAGCRDCRTGTLYGPPCSAEELPRTLGWCAHGTLFSSCERVPAEQGEACQLGCVMQMCQETSPEWMLSRAREASCSDKRGPAYWRNFLTAMHACEQKHGSAWQAMSDCTTADVELHCPELAGTNWADSWPGRYR